MSYLLAIFPPDRDISPIIDCFGKFDVPFEVQSSFEGLVPFAKNYVAQMGLIAIIKEEIESIPDVPGQTVPSEAGLFCDSQLADNLERFDSFNTHGVLSSETIGKEEVEDVEEEVINDLPFNWRDDTNPPEAYVMVGENGENAEEEKSNSTEMMAPDGRIEEKDEEEMTVDQLVAQNAQLSKMIYENQNQDICEQKCPVYGCVDKFSTTKGLWSHMNRHPKPLLCAVCRHVCPNGSRLRVHFRTHSGEKPFPCHICDNKFSQEGNLKTHLRRAHAIQASKVRQDVNRSFSCPNCDKAFAYSSLLDRHMRTHTGEKPYECEDCGYKASRQSYLNVHKRIHTGGGPYSCTGCGFKTAYLSGLHQHKTRFSH